MADRAQILYVPPRLAAEIRATALDKDRPIAWLLTYAWGLARNEISKLEPPPFPVERKRKGWLAREPE